MSFVDEVTFYAKAGDGGNGVVRFRHGKGREFMGPSGGNGGNGGDVFIEAVRDNNILAKQRYTKEYNAENGEAGKNNSEHGKNGKDYSIQLPIGAVVKNESTGEIFELMEEGQKIKVLAGGRGGLGNEYFKSSTNQAPEKATDGKEGEDAMFYVELQLVADIGFLGLPNAGKSSLLNVLTNAHAKVGNFNFTTLDPNLGIHFGLVLADIPGIIEGASEGKGLGYKFLRHIKRTKVLLHCISFGNDDIVEKYQVIRNEVESYSKELAEKPEIILLTKSDEVDEEELESALNKMKDYSENVLSVSIYDDEAIKRLSNFITNFEFLKKTEK